MDLHLTSRPLASLRWLVALLCITYLLSGIIGHDPWKTDDAVGSALAHGFLFGEHWLVPTLAGEPWLEAEPLYYWIAATLAWLTQLFLPFHDGARLASPLLGALFLVILGFTGRKLYGETALWGTPLLAIGTLGLLVPIHETQAFAAILATTASVYLGLSLVGQRPGLGGGVTGAGLGASFLAGGLNAFIPPALLLLTLLPKRQWLPLGLAIMTAAVVGGSWPLLLAIQQPAFLQTWWAAELSSLTPRDAFTAGHLKMLGWFAWPVVYIAIWTLWRHRHQLRYTPGVLMPAVGALLGLAWFFSHGAKSISATAMIPPLILLASAGVTTLRRGAANAWDWFGMMTFSMVAILVWLGTSALQIGWPAKIASNAAKLAPGFVSEFSPLAVLVGLLATIGWGLALMRLPRSPWRMAVRWATGITVVWILVVALLTSWINYGKSYRSVVADLRHALPESSECIGRMHLGAPQRAALDYFAGIRTRWGNKTCPWLIVQGGENDETPSGWTKRWEGHRPGDRNEWLRLYQRAP